MNWALALMVLAMATWPAGSRAVAQSMPPLPAPLRKLLTESGVLPQGGATQFLDKWRALYQVPVRNAEFVALMDRARREDQIVPLTHPLFAPETAAVGLWHSAFYISTYGTALVLAEPYAENQIPVILLPGIGGSARDFAEMVPTLQESGYQPVYFVYPSGMALSSAAHQLRGRLQEFVQRHDVDRLVVIGHSMGGVVAKGLLDEIDVSGDLASWRLFISISAPFGGVNTAQYAERLPQHPPAWDDLAPNSAFMQQIRARRFPPDLHFYLIFGSRSSNRLMGALGNNDGVLTLDSMCGSPLTTWATDVFGFYEDHTSILAAPRVFQRLVSVLETERSR